MGICSNLSFDERRRPRQVPYATTMKPSFRILLAVTHLPCLHAVPMLAREACTCQALSPLTHQLASYNDAMASCNRIAKDIERWRWPLHTPKLADAFVSIEPLEHLSALNVSKNYGRRMHEGYEAESKGVRSSITLAENTEGAGTASTTFIESQQRFRILCQRDPTIEPYAVHSSFAIFVGISLLWFFIFEITVRAWFT